MSNRKVLGVFVVLVFIAAPVFSADMYVSANKGDNGNAGNSKEAPFAELDKAANKAKAGDTIHVAAGRYYGIGKTAATEIKEAVAILGGYDDAFTSRDSKKNQTILTGDNSSKSLGSGKPRLRLIAKNGNVMVDGIVFDMAERNNYSDGKVVVRKANPKTGTNASLDAPTLEIGTGDGGAITVKNCLVLNSTHTGIRVKAGKGVKVNISNNFIINSAGIGLELNTTHHSNEGQPEFEVSHNSILFVWKYDGYGTRGGEGINFDGKLKLALTNNIIAFADNYAIVNGKGNKSLAAVNNILFGSGQADYWEGDLMLAAKEMGDGKLIESAKGNTNKNLSFKVNQDWANLYAARVLIDRNKVEADVKAKNTFANELRSILGLPLQAADVKLDANVHAHPMPLDGAFLVSADAGAAGAK